MGVALGWSLARCLLPAVESPDLGVREKFACVPPPDGCPAPGLHSDAVVDRGTHTGPPAVAPHRAVSAFRRGEAQRIRPASFTVAELRKTTKTTTRTALDAPRGWQRAASEGFDAVEQAVASGEAIGRPPARLGPSALLSVSLPGTPSTATTPGERHRVWLSAKPAGAGNQPSRLHGRGPQLNGGPAANEDRQRTKAVLLPPRVL